MVQVVELVFDILERLPLQRENIENTQLTMVMHLYIENCTGMPEMANRALNIIQRWQAMIFGLSYKYDKEGAHERKQRELRETL